MIAFAARASVGLLVVYLLKWSHMVFNSSFLFTLSATQPKRCNILYESKRQMIWSRIYIYSVWNSRFWTLRFRQIISFNHFPWFDCGNLDDRRLLCTNIWHLKRFFYELLGLERLVLFWYQNLEVSYGKDYIRFCGKSMQKCFKTRQLQHLKINQFFVLLLINILIYVVCWNFYFHLS